MSLSSAWRVVGVLILAVAFLPSGLKAQVYVSNLGNNTLGTSWDTALVSLSEAVAQAESSAQDVWIDGDTFTIESTVTVPSGVNIYGGFSLEGFPVFEDRDPELYETILDGDGVASPILAYSGSVNLVVDGITFTNASGNRGGAIAVLSAADLDILDCKFRENTASNMGAGIYIEEAHADIEGCVFEDNVAAEAAALMLFRGSANVVQSEFRRNNTTRQGGAIQAFDQPLFVDRCIFEENSGSKGGAIAAGQSLGLTITNSLFLNNFASEHGGAATFESQPGVVIANCTFVNNTATLEGGGVFFHSSDGAVSNCIFVNNNNHAIYESEEGLDSFFVLNNLFHNNPDGVYFDEASVSIGSAEGDDGLNAMLGEASGNLDGDPIFSFPESGNYHLWITSPAIDAGTTFNAPPVDVDGEARPVGGTYDIGYDEFLDSDGDTLSDFEEVFTYGTDPDVFDTDGDGVGDGDEVAAGTDPLDTLDDGDNEAGIGACFIATAAYGTPLAEEIGILRTFRDETLLRSAAGTAFTDTYYRLSPALADRLVDHPRLAAATRVALAPVLILVGAQPQSSGWLFAVAACLLAALGRRILSRTRQGRVVN